MPIKQGSTIKSIRWNVLSRVITFLIHLMAGYFLNRIVPRELFGQVFVASSIIVFGQMLLTLELSNTLVRQKNVTRNQLSTAFWVIFGFGFLLFSLFQLLAEPIANFFSGDEAFSFYIKLFSLVFLVTPISVIPNVLIRRALRFDVIARINVIMKAIVALTGLLFALNGRPILALAFFYGFLPILIAFGNLSAHFWLPVFRFDFMFLKKHSRLNFSLLFTQLTQYIVDYLDLQLVSKQWGHALTGEYGKAVGFVKMPRNYIANAISSVVFPSLSLKGKTLEQANEEFRHAAKLLAFILFPLFTIVFVLAYPFAQAYFSISVDWDIPNLVRLLRIFCVAGLVSVFDPLFYSLMMAKSRPRLIFNVGFLKRVIIIAAIIMAFKTGVMAVAIGKMLAELVAFAINLIVGKKELNFPVFRFLQTLLPTLINAIISACLAYLLYLFIFHDVNDMIAVLIGGVLGLVFYVLLAVTFDKTGWQDFKDFLHKT